MQKTPNYNLNKLETNDIVDFEVLNDNVNTLDTELKKASDKANDAYNTANNTKPASKITYNDTATQLGASDVQGAVQALNAKVTENFNKSVTNTEYTIIQDLNEFKELDKIGYIEANTTLNKPYGSNLFGRVINMGRNYSSSTGEYQPTFVQYVFFNNNTTWARNYVSWSNPVWGDWQKILLTGDIVNSDTINDTTKVPSSAVTYALGQEIDAISNNIDNYYSLKGGIEILEGEDLNDPKFREPGNYFCTLDTIAKTILNIPLDMPKQAFVMHVFLGTGIAYPVQQIETFNSGDIWRRVYDSFFERYENWAGYLKTTDIVNSDTVNDIVKVPSSAVTYALGQEIDWVKSKAPEDLSYITSFVTRNNSVTNISSTIRDDITYMIINKGIQTGGFGFANVAYSDRPPVAAMWGYIEYFKHADKYVTVKFYPDDLNNFGIYISQFILGETTWHTDWKKIT